MFLGQMEKEMFFLDSLISWVVSDMLFLEMLWVSAPSLPLILSPSLAFCPGAPHLLVSCEGAVGPCRAWGCEITSFLPLA